MHTAHTLVCGDDGDAIDDQAVVTGRAQREEQ
jgi:hypothetical protein